MAQSVLIQKSDKKFEFLQSDDEGRAEVASKMVNDAGTEMFTSTNPGVMQLSGSNVEQTIGAAAPTKALYLGASDGTNLQGLTILNSDATFNPSLYKGLVSKAVMHAYDETNITPWRNNTEGTLLASAARTEIVVCANQVNYNARGVHVIIRVTIASGTGGLILYINEVTALGASASLLTATAAITATGIYTYELYPGVGVKTGEVKERVSGALPRRWNVSIGVGDASSYEYSAEYALIL